MASTAAAPNGSTAPSAKVDELRDALASKGLKVKDAILARLASRKSFKGLAPVETLTSAQDPEPELAKSNQNVELGVNTTAQNQEEAAGLEKKVKASITRKPNQDASDKATEISAFSESSNKFQKQDGSPTLATSEGAEFSALANGGLQIYPEQQRKQLRSECFGIVSNDEKLKLRAARFGITNDANEEAEKKRARAARFGIIDEDAKKKARLERFAKDSEQDNEEENEKRKARALRFALSTEQSIAKVEEI